MSLNLVSLLRASAHKHPDNVAITCGDTRMTYRTLHETCQSLAGGLRSIGLTPGQHVALLLPNVPQFAVAYFGCHYAACPVVPLNVLFTAEEIAYHLADSDAAAVIVWERFLPQVQEALLRVPTCRLIVVGAQAAPTGAHSLASLLTSTPVRDVPPTMPDDPAVILYTSGTTGRAKGAMLSHFNLYYNAECIANYLLQLSSSTVALCPLPLFHSFGQTGMQNVTFSVGGHLVLMPRFEPRSAIEAIERHRVTFIAAVPSMYFALLEQLGQAGAGAPDLSSIEHYISGGAPMPVELIRSFKQRFNIDIMEGYGLSETSPAASFSLLDRPKKPGSIGVPIHGVEFRLERPDGTVITAPGEPGEICIKGHNVMGGYYKRPDETQKAIRDGWFHSGDVGVVDEDGDYTIVDRLKDMIIHGGFNVYPREVEEVLYRHPAVAEAAVIGVPNAMQGEEIKAVVVLKPGHTATEQDIITHCRAQMAVYKYPRSVEFRAELPKGPTGKIQKRELRSGG
jgi:long-chain acyl-CoA synthetase